MSLNRPFTLNHEDGEDDVGGLKSGRRQKWQSFIAGLEEDCSDDDEQVTESDEARQSQKQALFHQKQAVFNQKQAVFNQMQAMPVFQFHQFPGIIQNNEPASAKRKQTEFQPFQSGIGINQTNRPPSAVTVESNEGGNRAPFDWRKPPSMNSLYMQKLRAGSTLGSGNIWGASSISSSSASSSSISKPQHQMQLQNKLDVPKIPVVILQLPSSLPLPEWISHHVHASNNSNNNSQGQATTSYPYHMMGMAKKVDKGYLEKASRVALSLAKELAKDYGSGSGSGSDEKNIMLNEQDIRVDNVVVTDTVNGQASFSMISPHSSLSSLSPSSSSSSMPSQRELIYRLGKMVYYELFTQKKFPPQASSAKSQASTSSPSFDNALRINEEGEGGANDSDTSYEQQGRKRQSRGVEPTQGKHQNHSEQLKQLGLPSSICRLVANMLENESCNSRGEDLFRPDESIASLSDVVCDLQQMVDEPNSFLHDSLIMRLEPIIPDKLYGRERELRQCLDVAEAVSRRESQSSQSQSAIMISGGAGDGKSTLMKKVTTILTTQKSWRRLYCKFDQEVRQPLSTISAAFDRFLADNIQDELRADIAKVFSADDMKVLGQFIPTLRQLVPMEETTSGMQQRDSLDKDATASKCRLHNLFGLLVKVLSDKGQLLVCMDDLQWTDPSSLELINGLIEGFGESYMDEEIISTGSSSNGSSKVMFMCCFRRHEGVDPMENFVEQMRNCNVKAEDPMEKFLEQMRNCNEINLTEIHLQGLSSEHNNAIVSDSLLYPRRLTRSLANLIHQKSTGNPLFVREFLNSLASENLLTYSLSRNKWQFDLELIEMKTISDGVADLLTRRLHRLPKDVLSGLQVMSCLGAEVKVDVLMNVKDVCGNSDIIKGLDCATQELLIVKKCNANLESYSFAHDMIQHTLYNGIGQEHLIHMLKEIANTMIARTTETRSDSVLFLIADLINRVGPKNTIEVEERQRYAQYNLLAGEKAIPDFALAFAYLESGISFLGEDCWEHSYKISLDLHTNAAYVQSALGETTLMFQRIDSVLKNAQSFDDKLDSMSVLINFLKMSGAASKASVYVFEVLKHLGENFPPDDFGDVNFIERELKSVQQSLPPTLNDLPTMKDSRLIKTMGFLGDAMIICHRKGSRQFPLVACRIVMLTLKYGVSVHSPSGLAGMALSHVALFQNYAEGYTFGKIAVALALEKSLQVLPMVNFYVTGMVYLWKEPIQIAIPSQLDSYKIAMKNGNLTVACANAMAYCYRKFFAGSTLQSVDKDLTFFLRTISRHKRTVAYRCLMPISNAIFSLTAGPRRPVWEGIRGFEDDDKNLTKSFEMKDMVIAERIVVITIMTNFIFRKYDEAENIVRQYQEFFEINASERPLNTIYRKFFAGLVAFNSLRDNQDQAYWMNIGLSAIQNMEAWTKECEWNFQNKLHLLRAEYHFTIGDFNRAAIEYQLAISSAQKHRFVHEEAIACELAGYFYNKCGRKDLSGSLFKQAYACYRSWGATTKANALLHLL